MKPQSRLLLILFILGLFVSIAVSFTKPINSEVPEVFVRHDKPAGQDVIAGYKHWTKVNPQPQVVFSRIAFQCSKPTAAQLSMEKENPHRDKFVVVYVNDIGRSAMMEQKLPVFPEGSVIVKEKLTTGSSTSPELLTVMRKREAGYDSDKGNWEYMVFDGAGQSLQASGKLENCQACHVSESATDYVSRIYLPAKVREKLR